MNARSLVLWPETEGLVTGEGPNVLWSQFHECNEPSCRVWSIPSLLRHSEASNSQNYIQWLEDFFNQLRANEHGDSQDMDVSLKLLRQAAMSEFAYSTSSLNYLALRIWELRKIIDDRKITSLYLAGKFYPEDEEAIRMMCLHRGVTVKGSSGQSAFVSSNRLRSFLQDFLRALEAGIWIVRHFLLYGTRRKAATNPQRIVAESDLVVVDYWAHQYAREGGLAPVRTYWNTFAPHLESRVRATGWLHIDLLKWDRHHLNAKRQSCLTMTQEDKAHALLQDCISFRVMSRALRRLFVLAIHRRKLFRQANQTGSTICELGINRILTQNVCSPRVLAELSLWQACFDKLAQEWSPGSKVIYLMEGQAWESILNSSLNQNQFCETLGVAPSLIHPTDTRYAQLCTPPSSTALPNAKFFAVLGPSSRETLEVWGASSTSIREVEAVRYASEIHQTSPGASIMNLLVVGEYNTLLNSRLLDLAQHLSELPCVQDVRFRPHPASAPSLETRPWVSVSGGTPITEDLQWSTAVLMSSVSLASLDVMLTGQPVAFVRSGLTRERDLLSTWSLATNVHDRPEVTQWAENTHLYGTPDVATIRRHLNLSSSFTRWDTLLDSWLS